MQNYERKNTPSPVSLMTSRRQISFVTHNWITTTFDKKKKSTNCKQLLFKKHDKIREVNVIIGLVVTAMLAVDLAQVTLQETGKNNGFKKRKGNFDK